MMGRRRDDGWAEDSGSAVFVPGMLNYRANYCLTFENALDYISPDG